MSKDTFFKDKVVLVTGGAGSIGREFCRGLLSLDVRSVRALDNNETALFELQESLRSDRLRVFQGDVRDRDRIRRALEGVDIVFHAAALKHVPLCEYNPFEAVKVNVLGTQTLIDASMDEGVEKFVMISTDKAVDPANVMGATKLLAEKLTVTANLYRGKRKTAFLCVRFGNVMGSRGSVIPVFKEQIRRRQAITVTDPDMTRFMMSVGDAFDLVMRATTMATGGEIFIIKMPSMRLADLAAVMVEAMAPRYGHSSDDIKVQYVGKRAGEKDHEDLMTESEARIALEMDDMFVILPQMAHGVWDFSYLKARPTRKRSYSSDRSKQLSKKRIREMIAPLLEEDGPCCGDVGRGPLE